MGSNREIFPHFNQLELNLRIIKYQTMRTFYNILVVLFLIFSKQLFGQSASFDTLARWNFNGSSWATVPGGILAPTPHRGIGTAALVNGPTVSFVLGNASTSVNNSSDSSAGSANFSWSTTNYPIISDNTLRGYQFNVSTLNKFSIRLSFDMFHSATSSRFVRLEYSTNGGVSWIPYTGPGTDTANLYRASLGGNRWYHNRLANFEGINAVDNNPAFRIRLVSVFTPGGTDYVAATNGQTYATTGTLRLDAVTILGNPPGIRFSNLFSCIGDTTEVTISHPGLTGVASASLRMTYNPDSLTYVGFNSLNPAFSGMAINGNNGVLTMNWNSTSNQTIPAGNIVKVRFRVNGNSNLTWDTLIVPSEFYDSAYNLLAQTFISGSINHRTTRLTWNRNICQGQSFTLGNQSYTTSGTYQGRRFGTGGTCDTLITLNLNVIPKQTNPSVTVCSNQPYAFNGVQVNSTGVYLDTLVNILGCDSIVQLNLTVNPAYNQNLSITICTGGSLQFGNQNLTVAGNYTNTFVSSRGCDSLVNLTLSVSSSTTIISSNGQNGFCPNGSVRIGLANPQPNATYTWRKDGAIIPNATSDTLFVNQTGNYQLAVQVSPTCIIQSNTLTIGVLNCNRITGDLRYDNNNQTPLAGIPVHLKSLLGNIVASDTTDSSGFYDMVGYANGNYLLDASINYTYGGVNSTDALQVTRFFTSLVSLGPLRIKAGDVNGSGITNSGDALLINRRITGLISSFSVGNFVNNLPSVNALGNPLVANLRALSTGDVNGTYNPQPTAPTLVLDTVFYGFGSGSTTIRFTSSGSGVFERGICWSTSPNPTVSGNKMVVGSGGYGFTQVFSGGMVGNQLHYARAFARTSTGIFYSNEKTFTPAPGQPCPGVSTVTDIDGNVYQGIQIGTQCWTQSNLKVSKYRNGDNIPTGLNISAWQNTTAGAYAIYNNDPVNDGLYGKLYNHYTVTDSRGLCPTGWHVPTDADWTALSNQLGGANEAGSAIMSTATQPTPGGWISPNTGATNYSGFTGYPGGYRSSLGDFDYVNQAGFWWSSSLYSGSNYLYRNVVYSATALHYGSGPRTIGFSVRCIRD